MCGKIVLTEAVLFGFGCLCLYCGMRSRYINLFRNGEKMKNLRRILTVFTAIMLIVGLCACSVESPYIGENGNWFVNGEDTGVSATGGKGDKGDKGEQGEAGMDITVTGFKKIDTVGSKDTYRVTFSTGATFDIELENGVTIADAATHTQQNPME